MRKSEKVDTLQKNLLQSSLYNVIQCLGYSQIHPTYKNQETVTQPQEKQQSIQTKPKMIQKLELGDKSFKAAIKLVTDWRSSARSSKINIRKTIPRWENPHPAHDNQTAKKKKIKVSKAAWDNHHISSRLLLTLYLKQCRTEYSGVTCLRGWKKMYIQWKYPSRIKMKSRHFQI